MCPALFFLLEQGRRKAKSLHPLGHGGWACCRSSAHRCLGLKGPSGQSSAPDAFAVPAPSLAGKPAVPGLGGNPWGSWLGPGDGPALDSFDPEAGPRWLKALAASPRPKAGDNNLFLPLLPPSAPGRGPENRSLSYSPLGSFADIPPLQAHLAGASPRRLSLQCQLEKPATAKGQDGGWGRDWSPSDATQDLMWAQVRSSSPSQGSGGVHCLRENNGEWELEGVSKERQGEEGAVLTPGLFSP